MNWKGNLQSTRKFGTQHDSAAAPATIQIIFLSTIIKQSVLKSS